MWKVSVSGRQGMVGFFPFFDIFVIVLFFIFQSFYNKHQLFCNQCNTFKRKRLGARELLAALFVIAKIWQDTHQTGNSAYLESGWGRGQEDRNGEG